MEIKTNRTKLCSTTIIVLSLILTLIPVVSGQDLNLPTPGEIVNAPGGALYNPWIDKEDSVQQFINLVNQYGGTYERIGKSSYNTDSRMPSDCKGDPNWDIVLFRFGNLNSEGTVMIDAYLHGNEFYGYQVLLSVMKWVLSSNDADAVRIRQNNQILVVPVVNYRMDRSNFNVPSWMTFNSYGDQLYKGINLNRNFSPSWPSSLSDANTDNNSGESPDSESESQALINAWNKYNPRIYWNLHQGIGPSTSCTATTTQASLDANEAKSLLSGIQSRLGPSSSRWSFNVGSSYGSGYSKDGAASRGSAGFLTEVSPGWDSSSSMKTNLETGNIFQNVRAMLVAFCQAVESSAPPPSTWSVSVSVDGGNGYVSPSGARTVNVGDTFSATATPSSGFEFLRWEFNGNLYSTSRTVTIPSQTGGSSHTLKAFFQSTPPPNNPGTVHATLQATGTILYTTPTQMRTGVNYEGPYDWHYGVTDAKIDADFTLFKQNNVDTIILNIIWSAFQTDINPARYNEQNIANIKRVLSKAEQYDINVCISFFQYWMDTSTGVPNWCIDPKTGNTRYLAIVRDRTIRGYFLEMVGDLVDEFKYSSAIECWSLLNEPMHMGSYSSQDLANEREEFHLLIEEGVNVIRARDNRQISVRFTLPYSPWHTGTSGIYDSFVDFDRVASALDFISINTYADPDSLTGIWQGTTWNEFFEAVQETKNAGLDFWVSEFGNNQGDESQRQHFESAIALFQEHDVDACFAWAWVHDSVDEAFNVCYPGGSPRPAFYELNLD